MIIVEPSYTILSPDPFNGRQMLKLIELAGRTCYKSEDRITDDSAGKFVEMIRNRNHESVLEHGVITVRFVFDRGVSHELVRHRIASFSQESTRYCNYGKKGEVSFIRPPFWTGDEGKRKREIWQNQMLAAEAAYLELIAEGAKPEEARSVLPNSLKTEIVTTTNVREWRHILTLRTGKAAHPQIRQVMIPLLDHLARELPEIFRDLVEATAVP